MPKSASRKAYRWDAPQLEQNRFGRVLLEANERKKLVTPFTRPLFAEQFFRENPMPWLLDSEPATLCDPIDI